MKESYERERFFFDLQCKTDLPLPWVPDGPSVLNRGLCCPAESAPLPGRCCGWGDHDATLRSGQSDWAAGSGWGSTVRWWRWWWRIRARCQHCDFLNSTIKKQSLSNRSLHPSNFLRGRVLLCWGSMLRYETKTNIWQSCFNLLCKYQSWGPWGCGHCLQQARRVNRTRRTEKWHHLQSLVVDGIDRVPLDACLPFALARIVGQQITFDVAGKQTHVRWNPAAGEVASVSRSFRLERNGKVSTAGFLRNSSYSPWDVITETQ